MTPEIVHRIIIDAQHPLLARARLLPVAGHLLAEADPYALSPRMQTLVRELAEDTDQIEPDAEVVAVGDIGTARALAVPGDLVIHLLARRVRGGDPR